MNLTKAEKRFCEVRSELNVLHVEKMHAKGLREIDAIKNQIVVAKKEKTNLMRFLR